MARITGKAIALYGAAGMSKLETAAAFIHANMPRAATEGEPILTEKEAWDVAVFVTSQPRPPQAAAAGGSD